MQTSPTTRQQRLTWAANYDQSPLTAQEYAAQAELSVATFYYWRQQLTRQKSAPAQPSFTAITLTEPVGQVPPATLHLRLKGDIEVHGPIEQLIAFTQQLDRHA